MKNKSKIIAENSGLTKSDVGRALDSLIQTIESTLKSGDSIALVGFGSFEVKERAERTGRNPQIGETITIV